MKKGKRFACLLCVVVPVCVAVLSAFGSIRAANDDAGYAGAEVCAGCHEKQVRTIGRNPHWKKAVKDAPANDKGCEACHGPGAAHVEQGGGTTAGLTTFSKREPSDKKSGICLGCHQNTPRLVMWDSGVHRKKDVACSDCHSAHGYVRAQLGYGTGLVGLGYTPGPQYQTCGRCHLDVKAQVNRRSHHPIVEGRITCSNCHQPHGATGPSQIKEASVNQLCYRCHAEKRGPFMWEHQPVDESCTICHKPHGSVHLRLVAEKVPNLCQACHDSTRHPGTRYSRETLFTGSAPSNRSFARACLNCHSNIHGSNAPANPANGFNTGAFFIR